MHRALALLLLIVGLPAGAQPAVKGDLTGDGKPDIAFVSPNSATPVLWVMNGVTRQSVVNLPDFIQAGVYEIQGTNDFNADGETDLLVRNQWGIGATDNWVWLMSDTSRQRVRSLPPLEQSMYRFRGTGDFNGDGKPDILVTNNQSGRQAIWIMNGTIVTGIVDLPGTAQPIQPMAVGDFNGDGKPDILLENFTTPPWILAIWIMDGTSVASIVDLPSPAGHTVGGAADFDGDGKTDVLLYDVGTARNAIWLMNGTSFASIVDLPKSPSMNQWTMSGPR